MNMFLQQVNTLDFNVSLFMKSFALLAIGSMVLGAVGRFVFGKRSCLHCAVSSAIGILFVYAVTIVLHSAGAGFQAFISPLPFVDIVGENLKIFVFKRSAFADICSQVLSMLVLSFLVNLLDSILPRGKKLITWLLLRILTVAGAIVLHLLTLWLFQLLLPQGFMQHSPSILMVLLVVYLLVSVLKLLTSAILATLNPIVGILYNFFFASIVGRAITKAGLTTAIIAVLVYMLGSIGVTVISITQAALIAYIPLAIVLLVMWYVINKLFGK